MVLVVIVSSPISEGYFRHGKHADVSRLAAHAAKTVRHAVFKRLLLINILTTGQFSKLRMEVL